MSARTVIEHALTVYYDGNAKLVRQLLADYDAEKLRDAADALDADMERFFGEWPDEPRNSPYALGRKDAATELRRMAGEAEATR